MFNRRRVGLSSTKEAHTDIAKCCHTKPAQEVVARILSVSRPGAGFVLPEEEAGEIIYILGRVMPAQHTLQGLSYERFLLREELMNVSCNSSNNQRIVKTWD